MMNLSTIEKTKIFLKEFAIRLLTFDYFIIKKIIRKEISLKKNDTILDLGCGTGILANLFFPDNYIGIDLEQKLIIFAKQKYPKYHFKVMDSTNVALLLPQRFDRVLIVGVIHHLTSSMSKKTLAGLKKILKRNGTILAIEAIPPVNKFNYIGKIFRAHDEGSHIVTMEEYSKIFSRYFNIAKSFKQPGGFFDYGVFLLKD